MPAPPKLACLFLDRYEFFKKAREALLRGDIHEAQDAAGRMPTDPKGFVSSFEYVGELQLEFGLDDASSSDSGEGGPMRDESRQGGAVEGYIRHLHLNNGTGA